MFTRPTFKVGRYLKTSQKPVADPEFPRLRGCQPQGGGTNLLFDQNFPQTA